MSSQQHTFLMKAGIRRDEFFKRHASPSASTRNLPRSPLSEGFPGTHIAHMAKKGIRNILHTRAKSVDHTQALMPVRGANSYPVPSSDMNVITGSSALASLDDRISLKSTPQSGSKRPRRPPMLNRSVSDMSATHQITTSPDAISEGSPSRPSTPSSLDIALMQAKNKTSCSRNLRLQKILADKDLGNIITDTSSLPSTAISTAKSTGVSMAPSSASSYFGTFPPRSAQETTLRMATTLPTVPAELARKTKEATPIADGESHIITETVVDGQLANEQSLDQDQTEDLESWKTCTYRAGNIKTDHTFGLYAIPFMTAMDVLCQSTAVNDEQVVDDMIDYFAALGLEPTVNTIDMFWKANDILTPISPPPKTGEPKKESSSKRASRQSQALKGSRLTIPSPSSLQPSTHLDGIAVSPLLNNTNRLSTGQQSTGSGGDRPGSSRDSQRSVSQNRGASPKITPQWVMAHRDPSATAYLAIPAGTSPTSPHSLLSPTHPHLAAQATSAPTSSNNVSRISQYLQQQQGQAQSYEGYDSAHRMARSPNRASDIFEGGTAGNVGGGHGTIRGRFSIRKILSRHNVPN